ncbi:MurR/RpiR family transcriptional regulator [Streptomyces sp. NPDC006314]|uniref:MurR/RpiR family transcriptional regulator n=1 Tax=Streptomyces sp. NPDC006314 TaxID=3154475 RepID=UPI0033B57236
MKTRQPPTDTRLCIRAGRAAPATAEQRVTDRILAEPAGADGQSVSEPTAAVTGSGATVVRGSRAVGRRGYRELRMALATGVAHEAARKRQRSVSDSDIGPDCAFRELVGKIGRADAREVTDTIENLERLEQLVAAISTARRINLSGVGASGFTASDLWREHYRSGLPAAAFEDSHAAPAQDGPSGDGDVHIGVSHQGTAAETVMVLGLTRRRDDLPAALTNALPSPITDAAPSLVDDADADAADAVLTPVVRASGPRSGAEVGRVPQLAPVDRVRTAVAQHTSHPTEAAAGGLRRRPRPAYGRTTP